MKRALLKQTKRMVQSIETGFVDIYFYKKNQKTDHREL